MQIFADSFTNVTLSNGNLRIQLIHEGPDDIQTEVATLILPVNKAPGFVNGMVNAMKELEAQIKTKRKEMPENDDLQRNE